MTKKFKKAMTFLLGFAMLGGVIGGAALASGEGGVGVHAATVEDTITYSVLSPEATGYTNHTYTSSTTNATYEGVLYQTSTQNLIQMRTSGSNSGLVVTTSGGVLEKVSVQFGGSTTSSRSVDIYGKNDNYTGSVDLYSTDSMVTGTNLRKVSFGGNTELQEVTEVQGYTAFGIKPVGGALYLSQVVVVWQGGATTTLTSINIENAGYPGEVYAGATWSTDGLVATGDYDDGSTKDITNSVTWNFDPATIPTTLGSTTVNVSATLDGIASNTLPITVEVVEAPAITSWDLTTASFSSASSASVVWSSNYVTMTWNKGTSNTPANNYLGGEHANSRIYKNQTFNVNAEPGCAIAQVIVTFVSSGNSSGLSGSWTTESSEVIKPIKTTDGEVLLTVDTSANPCTSISTTCTATTYISKVEVEYTTKEVVVPTVAEVAFTSGKGSYFNGSLKDSNTFSTADLVVTTKDDAGNVAAQYNTGTGFVVIINGESLDATTAIQTKSFEGATAGSYPLAVTVEGLTSNEINLTVIQKDVESFNWDKPQTTTFYSHVDELALDGTLRTLFNDGSYATSASRYAFIVREYSETLPNNAGAEVELATHQDGTLNVTEASQYVLEIWNTDYPNSLHTYVTINVELPTLTIVDNFTGAYYTNVTRELDVTVTLTAGQTVKTLTKDEYTLSQTSVTPASTDPINVYPILVKDGQQVMTGTTPLVITPEVSTKVLNELAIDDATYSAGSYFVLPHESILLDYTLGDVNDLEYLSQDNLVFQAANGEVIDMNTRLLRSHSGLVTATYSEGVGEVSTTFNLTVTNAVVEEYVEPSVSDTATLTTSIEIGDIVYLVNEGAAKELSEISVKNYGTVADYTGTINRLVPLEVVAGATEATYALKLGDSYLSLNSDDNNLHTRTDVNKNSSWTIIFDGNNAIIKNVAYPTRQLQYNAGSPRFACYKSTQQPVQLYESEVTPGVGDPVSYLKSVIDAYRLNNNLLSICDVDTQIYASSDWTKAKEVYNSLDASEKQALAVQDYFGEEGKTYVDTYEMLLAKDPAAQGGLAPTFFGNEDTTIAVVVVIITLAAVTALVGFYYYDKRRRVNK